MNKIIGANVRRFRKAKKMRQTKLGGYLDVHQAAVSRIENGEQNLLAKDLLILSKVLKQPLEAFFEKSHRKSKEQHGSN